MIWPPRQHSFEPPPTKTTTSAADVSHWAAVASTLVLSARLAFLHDDVRSPLMAMVGPVWLRHDPVAGGGGGGGGGNAALTVTLAVPLFPSLVPVITAVPAATPRASPLPDTVATPGALVAQLTLRPVREVPLVSFGVAVSCTVCPTATLAVAGLTATDATGAPGGVWVGPWQLPLPLSANVLPAMGTNCQS